MHCKHFVDVDVVVVVVVVVVVLFVLFTVGFSSQVGITQICLKSESLDGLSFKLYEKVNGYIMSSRSSFGKPASGSATLRQAEPVSGAE